VNERQNAGEYRAFWNAGSAPAGIYILKMEAAGQLRTQKLTIEK